ncbi:MAG: hypothetical protein UT64_C0017G0005 [Candidatus Falkowbacteria bacterium GW2011_GWF2_39_8]|uniref:Uncharacterized protein n=1 Tax=Candidatus Falkowbacteria bacterium GW2011_GWF2_39_8 TaxID=1618642 RepID=A0A0G0T525_9BACT|nr:MAG: hypothetical protein UT64_C0017G0005 [Candidatus Falkowbacteria bacterium GW2011_GWF2_39_8]
MNYEVKNYKFFPSVISKRSERSRRELTISILELTTYNHFKSALKLFLIVIFIFILLHLPEISPRLLTRRDDRGNYFTG